MQVLLPPEQLKLLVKLQPINKNNFLISAEILDLAIPGSIRQTELHNSEDLKNLILSKIFI